VKHPTKYRLHPSMPDRDKAEIIGNRADDIIRLYREMGKAPDTYVLEPYPDDNGDHRWIFRRNVIRNALNRYESCRRTNLAWLTAGIISAEEWAESDEMHAGYLRRAVELIERLPPEERQELAPVLPVKKQDVQAMIPLWERPDAPTNSIHG